jgi:hypothetical protein
MSYRPICDFWFLARAKLKGGHKYYGAYLGGFPERARALLGVNLNEPVLHVCGGMAKHYPYKRGFGPNDKTFDIDPSVEPDFLGDARQTWPQSIGSGLWRGVLIDPPYSEADAEHYNAGAAAYPPPNLLLKRAFEVLAPGGRAGIIHYILPKAPDESIFVAAVGICCGFNNRIRVYSVYEKPQGE